MAELMMGAELHNSYKARNKPELARLQAELAKLQAIQNPDERVLKRIKAYQRCIDSIKINLYIIEEIYEKNTYKRKSR